LPGIRRDQEKFAAVARAPKCHGAPMIPSLGLGDLGDFGDFGDARY